MLFMFNWFLLTAIYGIAPSHKMMVTFHFSSPAHNLTRIQKGASLIRINSNGLSRPRDNCLRDLNPAATSLCINVQPLRSNIRFWECRFSVFQGLNIWYVNLKKSNVFLSLKKKKKTHITYTTSIFLLSCLTKGDLFLCGIRFLLSRWLLGWWLHVGMGPPSQFMHIETRRENGSHTYATHILFTVVHTLGFFFNTQRCKKQQLDIGLQRAFRWQTLHLFFSAFHAPSNLITW